MKNVSLFLIAFLSVATGSMHAAGDAPGGGAQLRRRVSAAGAAALAGSRRATRQAEQRAGVTDDCCGLSTDQRCAIYWALMIAAGGAAALNMEAITDGFMCGSGWANC